MRGFSGFTIIVATILSTIIHFFVLTILDTLPLIPKAITPRADIFMVDLMTLKTASAFPPKEETKTVQTQETVEVKKPEEKKELKKEEKQEAPKDQVVLADRGKEQKEKKTQPKGDDGQQQLAAAIKGIEQKVAGRGKGDSPGAEMTEAETREYDEKAAEKVKSFWAILNIWSKEELEAKIVVEIDERGQMTPRFEQSSGNLAFDQAALRAISKAAPLGPPPGNEPRKIPLRFSSH